jgi:hypothetical protein
VKGDENWFEVMEGVEELQVRSASNPHAFPIQKTLKIVCCTVRKMSKKQKCISTVTHRCDR